MWDKFKGFLVHYLITQRNLCGIDVSQIKSKKEKEKVNDLLGWMFCGEYH
jgi:hypothetical protein